jgi:hypothetical protein
MLLGRAHLYLPFTKACVEALLGLSGWSPQHFSRAQVELRTVLGTRNHVALAFAFVEWPSSVSACVGYGAHLSVLRAAYQHINTFYIHRSHRACFKLALLENSGKPTHHSASFFD